MSNENLTNQVKATELVGKKMLLISQGNYQVVVVELVEVTQHKYRVKLADKDNATVIGMKKKDVVLFPNTPKNETRLIVIAKKIKDAENAFMEFKNKKAYDFSLK